MSKLSRAKRLVGKKINIYFDTVGTVVEVAVREADGVRFNRSGKDPVLALKLQFESGKCLWLKVPSRPERVSLL
jgi:hypothetical protein